MSAPLGPLGRDSGYEDRYNPELLYPIPRVDYRQELPAVASEGADYWRAWELSWLQPGGLPAVGVGLIAIPADSPRIPESKSLKLYLNSFNNTAFDDRDAVARTIETDLTALCGKACVVTVSSVSGITAWRTAPAESRTLDLDNLAVSLEEPLPVAPALECADGKPVAQDFSSDLLRSLCPVTGQPDWASIRVRIHAKPLVPESLLRYLVSFRQHGGFHEQCVEQIFGDLMRACEPSALAVEARYLRRGGIDISPCRYYGMSGDIPPAHPRQ